MKRQRFIVIDAALAEHPAVRDDPPAMALLVHLLCTVHAKPEPFDYNVDGVVVTLNQGQCFFALRHWAGKVKMSYKVARRVYDKLQSSGTVLVEPIRKGARRGAQAGTKKGAQAGYIKGARVTLPNFAVYQDFGAYGNPKGRTGGSTGGRKEGRTGGKAKGRMTYPEVPTQDIPTQKESTAEKQKPLVSETPTRKRVGVPTEKSSTPAAESTTDNARHSKTQAARGRRCLNLMTELLAGKGGSYPPHPTEAHKRQAAAILKQFKIDGELHPKFEQACKAVKKGNHANVADVMRALQTELGMARVTYTDADYAKINASFAAKTQAAARSVTPADVDLLRRAAPDEADVSATAARTLFGKAYKDRLWEPDQTRAWLRLIADNPEEGHSANGGGMPGGADVQGLYALLERA